MIHFTPRKRSSAPRPRRERMSLDLNPGPSARSINAILNYSKALKVVELPPVGRIDIILN